MIGEHWNVTVEIIKIVLKLAGMIMPAVEWISYFDLK